MKKIIIAFVIIGSLASCNRYVSPFPDGHPCVKERKPNIFKH